MEFNEEHSPPVFLATVVAPPDSTEVCRFCHQPGDLIAPCGTCLRFYCHRQCLNAQRTNVDYPQRMYSCDVCKQDFKLMRAVHPRRFRFHALVLRDFFFVFCVLQLTIFTLAVLVKTLDEAMAFCVPACQPETPVLGEACIECTPIKHIFFHNGDGYEKSTYYVCGVLFFLCGLGCFGVCNHVCCECMAQPPPPVMMVHRSHNTVCCINNSGGSNDCCCCFNSGHNDCCCCFNGGHNDCCCCCSDCERGHHHHHHSSSGDCCKGGGGSSSGGDNKGGEFLVVVFILVAVVVIAFAVIGIFYGLVLVTALFQRVVQRHVYLLELQTMANDYPVANLALPLDDSIPFAQVVSEVRELV